LDGYGRDLAYVHDRGFSSFSESAAPWLLGWLSRRVPQGGLVVELGCGSGRLARRLAEAGYEVLGIDRSGDTLSLARRNAPGARFRRGSLETAPLPPCHAILALGEVLNYRFGRPRPARSLLRLFLRMRAALRPGGLLVFDLAGPGRVPGGRAEGSRLGRDWAVLFRSEEDLARHTLTRRITTFRRVGGAYRRSEEVHVLSLFREGEVLEALAAAGFSARALRGYGELRLGPGLRVFLALGPGGDPSSSTPRGKRRIRRRRRTR